MIETKKLLRVIKNMLREQGITYAAIAKQLSLSEASVKRMFHKQDMSISRLEQITAMLNLGFTELIELLDKDTPYVSMLNLKQEESLIKHPKQLLTLFLLINGWPVQSITDTFNINEHEIINILASLDKLKLIELLPFNKVKLLTARNFSWQSNGPVQKFFEEQVLKDFFDSNFQQHNEKLVFVAGALTDQSQMKIQQQIDNLARSFDELSRADAKLPLDQRSSFGAVFSIRRWEFSVFNKMRRVAL